MFTNRVLASGYQFALDTRSSMNTVMYAVCLAFIDSFGSGHPKRLRFKGLRGLPYERTGHGTRVNGMSGEARD